MRILFLGDIVGKPGRKAVAENLYDLKKNLKLDFVIANAENASGGIGITVKNAKELKNCGINVLTSGNHIWRHKEIADFLNNCSWLLRPANYPPEVPGSGAGIFSFGSGIKIGVVNLLGRTFMDSVDCPFRKAKEILNRLSEETRIIIIDFHAEATSEKLALLHYIGDRCTALLGTHTHVQTNDARIFRGKTAYITDLGMCGPYDSIIGMDPKLIVKRFVHSVPQKFEVAQGEVLMQGALLDIDTSTGQALDIQPWQQMA